MVNIEVRTATNEDIARINGQLAECVSIHVEILGGEFGSLDKLAQLLNDRSLFLEQILNKALAGELLTFHDGLVSFQAEVEI